jgi:ribosomal protein S6--L-glutamate ligase
MTLGIAINPYAPNVSKNLIETAHKLSIAVRIIDLPSLTVSIGDKGKSLVKDKEGDIIIDSLAPYLLFGFPAALSAFRILSQKAFLQNPVDNVLIADDKAATAERLAFAKIPQVATIVCSSDIAVVLSSAAQIGYPVVVKRTHGAQGRWVRNAVNEDSLKTVHKELLVEGSTALLLQPQIIEAKGRSIRAVVTGGKILAVTERIAKKSEWRSNIVNGAMQHPIDLDDHERKIVLDASKAIGLRHAGIDLLRTAKGTVVLEVNSCPDYTSMLSYCSEDLSTAVLKASLGNLLIL